MKTNHPELCRQRLYQARTAAQDIDLEKLSLVIPAVPGEVWIVRRIP